ncbi:hypothetical protein D3C75_800780 [compost metagenome]
MCAVSVAESSGVSLTPSRVMVIVCGALSATPSEAWTTKSTVWVLFRASTALSSATNLYSPLVVLRKKVP